MESTIKGYEWIHLEIIDSTNDYLKDKIRSGELGKAVVLADKQTKGRGRQMRKWLSPVGGLYLSISYDVTDKNYSPILVTAALGVALANVLISEYHVPAKLKWPNDIMIDGKKLCGVLSELVTLKESAYVIAGIGMNVNRIIDLQNEAQDTANTAICLAELTSKQCKINRLATQIVKSINNTWNILELEGAKSILDKWRKLSETIGSEIEVVGNEIIKGTCTGINENFELLVNCDGVQKTVFEGDVKRLLPYSKIKGE